MSYLESIRRLRQITKRRTFLRVARAQSQDTGLYRPPTLYACSAQLLHVCISSHQGWGFSFAFHVALKNVLRKPEDYSNEWSEITPEVLCQELYFCPYGSGNMTSNSVARLGLGNKHSSHQHNRLGC